MSDKDDAARASRMRKSRELRKARSEAYEAYERACDEADKACEARDRASKAFDAACDALCEAGTTFDMGEFVCDGGQTFRVGDEVEYEDRSRYRDYPRWYHDGERAKDFGGSGEMVRGTIFAIKDRGYYGPWLGVESSHGTRSIWPLHGNRLYASDQWQRPGFLRRR
jgi:hypothetical protein